MTNCKCGCRCSPVNTNNLPSGKREAQSVINGFKMMMSYDLRSLSRQEQITYYDTLLEEAHNWNEAREKLLKEEENANQS
jgi:hypothetical protein